MADFDSNRIIRGQAAEASAVDAGLRKYMLQVYNYMFLALIVTGVTAFGVFSMATTSDPTAAVATLRGGVMLTSIGAALFGSPLAYVLAFGPLVFSLFIWGRIQNGSLGGAQMWFWAFAICVGFSMSMIFLIFQLPSIAEVFFITAAAFGGLSLVGYTTKRDLSGIGSFLIMGVWGLIIASVVNMFMQNGMMQWIISVAGVGIFAGLTAYYTQTIKEMYYAGDDGTVAAKKAIWGALALYMSFINMFRFLLYLMGSRR